MRFAPAFALVASVPALVSALEHIVNVGEGGNLTFSPASTIAAIGDTVTFTFLTKNHSVVQSSFPAPCTKLNANGTVGFASDFMPVTPGSSNPPTFSINVTQTTPIWFYCAQKIPAVHCNLGMVGAINPTADKTVAEFQAAAMAAANSSASGSNSTSTNGTASSPSGTGAAPAATKASSAMRLSGSAAGLLSLLGLMAGLAL